MNADHAADNLLIARAFGCPGATESRMVGATGEAGVWLVVDAAGERELSVAWPGGAITERSEIRREVVALYRAACEKLGVPAREEHAPEAGSRAHRGARSDHGRHAADPVAEAAEERPFSVVVRESSWSDHSDSEGSSFMEDIMRGRGTLQDYADLVAQHYYVYEALEEAAARFVGDPAFAPFHRDALARMPALEADLAQLLGDGWRDRIAAVPATEAYAARIREVAEEGWLAGLVAHHYTRYLGDLSGGQMIARRVAKQHGLDRDGVAFYDFSDLGSLTDFKNEYRAALDLLGASLDDAEKARMLEEVRAAYGFNTAVFADLGRAEAAA
ncbi:heme oxygenase [Leucobacter sp. wl10]|nr:heme oxygenase [Leucobacter sp. wl10]